MADRCIAPYEIQEGDLVAYLDGVAPPEVVDHIARCPFCAAEIEALRKVDALLSNALHQADDLPIDNPSSGTESRGKRT